MISENQSSSMSSSKRILFLPFNTPGHINGGIAIADQLAREHNYECHFVTIGKIFGEDIRAHGHQLLELADLSMPNDPKLAAVAIRESVKQLLSPGAGLVDVDSEPGLALEWMVEKMGVHFGKSLESNHEQFGPLIDELKPALVLIDSFTPPPCLINGEAGSIPWVRINSSVPNIILKSKLAKDQLPSPFLGIPLTSKSERERLRREEPAKWAAQLHEWQSQTEKTRKMFSKMVASMRDYYTRHGCESKLPAEAECGPLLFIDSPQLNIYLYPEALDFRRDDDLFVYPKRYLQCNSLMREPSLSAQERNHWLRLIEQKSADKEACVLFSLGSIASGQSAFVRRFVEMLATDQRRLYIVSKGGEGDQVQLDERNMIGANYIPQPFLIQHCQLAVVHGGNNGICECLHYGVPLVVLPAFGDQFDNAQRVEDSRVGRRLSLYRCTREQLIGTIDELLADSELRARVRAIGEQMRRRDDLGRVSEALHELVETGELSEGTLEKLSITK